MKIAIVDDQRDELTAAETYLREYLRENFSEDEPDIQIDTFTCARDLLKIFKPGMYRLIILDIVMPEINGMQAAQVIRARGDNEANIVFLTGSDDYVLNGYRVFAVGYFMKPITNHAAEFAKTLLLRAQMIQPQYIDKRTRPPVCSKSTKASYFFAKLSSELMPSP